MARPHSHRDAETRDAESRDYDFNDVQFLNKDDPYYVPPHLKKDGYTYRYVRIDVRGYNDYNIEKAMRDGYTPVPNDRGGVVIDDPLGRNRHGNKYVTIIDSMLMERPAIFSEREREELHKVNASTMGNLNGVVNSWDANPRLINNF